MNKHALFALLAVAACGPLPPDTVMVVEPLPSAQTSIGCSCTAVDVRADCSEVQRKCAQRGFYPGGYTEGKGIKYDCLDLLLRGGAVSGVSVPSEDVACIRYQASRAGGAGSNAENDFENQCIYTSNAFATDAMNQKRRACDAIDEACRAAGYYFGGASQGRGIQMDCVKPLYGGKPVSGLRVDASAIQACFGVNLDDEVGLDMALNDSAQIAPALGP